ncbi:hypothetical protein [Streptomyces demainii]|uniref:Uncharacterized protein n=1 Tax=Streptomyces demainii TaxID=588122 RepID=A0ABT9KM23_9ACTN|nr:hypothetical protein [Streptomyces demainii]MDP9609482.1 hypothetical protein [Streptomyces demainii]
MSQQRKEKNWFARHKVLTGAGALITVIALGSALSGGGSGGGSGGDKGNGTDTAASSADGGSGKHRKETGKTEPKKTKTAFSGDGTLQVGTDVRPGTYRTTGNTNGMCYWERAKNSSGQPDAILANDNVTGSSYVTIKASDKIFTSQGCEDWEAVPATASGTPKTEMAGDGMYRVGADIAPGTYKSTGNGSDNGCYWERTKDALHGIDSIIANDNASGNAIVTIGAQDGYFKTNGCENWKKTG